MATEAKPLTAKFAKNIREDREVRVVQLELNIDLFDAPH
jgi:hypothetical protein